MLQRRPSIAHLDTICMLPFDAVSSSPIVGSKRRLPGVQKETTIAWVLSVAVFFCIAAGGYFCLESTLQNDLRSKDLFSGSEQDENLALLMEDLHAENSVLYSEISKLRNQISTLQREKTNQRDDPSEFGYKVQSHRLTSDKRRLEGAIQDMSTRHLLEKFGSGPYYVEVTLDASLKEGQEAANGEGVFDRLIIELSSNAMPHSSDWFLDKVDKQLFDGTSFSQTNEGELALAMAPHLKGDSFPQLVFNEQHIEKQLPIPYAVGLRSGPGGISVYLNTAAVETSLQTSPAGDNNPSFAKVIEGFDRLDRIIEGNGKTRQGSVSIRSMRLLSSYEPTLIL